MNQYNSAGARRARVTLSDSQFGITLGWYADPTKLTKLSGVLQRLAWMLSSILLCLVLANVGWTAPGNARVHKAEAETALKKGTDREAVLANVRATLGEKIRNELVTLPQYDVFDNVEFQLDENDMVTLSGQVRLPSLKVSAERVVAKIEGVINQLEVLPTSAFDDDIRRVAFLQIYSYSQLSRYGLQAVPPIHIIVRNGKLTLEGVVATESDKTLAGIRANQVTNVFAVVNNLRVENQ